MEPLAYEAVVLLGDHGGWHDWPGKWQGNASAAKRKAKQAETDEAEVKAKEASRSLKPAKRTRTSK